MSYLRSFPLKWFILKREQKFCMIIRFQLREIELVENSFSLIDQQLFGAVDSSFLTKLQTLPFSVFPMNHHPYGIAKQLYRTSYSPAVDNNRPSSLNNLNLSQYHHQPILHIRPDSNIPTILVSKNNLSNSQAYQMDHKVKTQASDYYTEQNKSDDLIKQMQMKIDELAKKVMKNTEDIKSLKKNNKNDSLSQLNFTPELDRMNKRQETIQRERLEKISELRNQLLEQTQKLHRFQSEDWQKINLRFQQKQLIRIRNLLEDRVKQETIKIKLIIDNQVNKITQDLREQLAHTNGRSPIKSRLKYPFRSTKITYSEFLKSDKIKDSSRLSTKQSCESPRSSKMLMSNQQVYYVDKQGFLLDEQNYYLLDKDERMIRLNSAMLQQLRRLGLLQNDS